MAVLEEGSAAAGGRRPTRPHRSAGNQQDDEPKLPRALPPARTIRLGQSSPFVLFGATPTATTERTLDMARSGRSAFPPQWAGRHRIDPCPRAKCPGAQPTGKTCTSRSRTLAGVGLRPASLSGTRCSRLGTDGRARGQVGQDRNGCTPVRGSDGPPSRKPGQHPERSAFCSSCSRDEAGEGSPHELSITPR